MHSVAITLALEMFDQVLKHSGFRTHFNNNEKIFSYRDGTCNESKVEKKPTIPW